MTRYPDIRFELRGSMEYTEIKDWVEKGAVDCDFVLLPAREELETVSLRRDAAGFGTACKFYFTNREKSCIMLSCGKKAAKFEC